MLTTRQVAKQLGIDTRTLNRYIRVKKVPAPETIQFGGFRVHSWSKEDVEQVRKLFGGKKAVTVEEGELEAVR